MLKTFRSLFAPAFLALILGCSPDPVSHDPWSLAELEIDVADTSREVAYTNTRAGFFYTESNQDHRNSWQGWHIRSVKLISDYRIDLNGRHLDRATCDYARLWPDRLTRSYHEGVQETFTLLDSIDAFVVSLANIRSDTVGLSLLLDASAAPEISRDSDSRTLIFTPFAAAARSARPDVPAWIGVAGADGDAAVYEADAGKPGKVSQPVRNGGAVFFVAAANTPGEVRTLLTRLQSDANKLAAARSERMERLLNASYVRTTNERFDKALAWAKLSMDALVMEQGRKGIFAGLPWFSNYWGRDTFISLPGATLVTGRFGEAREVLRSFAAWQNTDRTSPDEGRIPNLVTPTSIAYNTADGTPWFVLGVLDYVRTSGDLAFLREVYPVIRLAADGPLRHRVDRAGFLTHGEAETWMDAVGPDGPWSPRGNRANDIQALWYRQLLASAEMAELAGRPEDAERWGLASEQVLFSFRAAFIDEAHDVVVDHLNADGTRDGSLRPNQLFTMDLLPFGPVRARVFRRLTEALVYPYGVGSLSPEDENFHPFHHAEPLYVQDAAYHNGIVWTWLNGPWIERAVELRKQELAYRVTDGMIHQILDRGAVGTISELLDAAPHAGESEPRLSGTFSQAWSLAEFIRTAYRSYLGITVNAIDGQIVLAPRLPLALREAAFDVHAGSGTVRVTYEGRGRHGDVTLTPRSLSQPVAVNLTWPLPEGRERTVHFMLPGLGTTQVSVSADAASAIDSDGSSLSIDTQVQDVPPDTLLASCSLASPRIRSGLRSLRGPAYELIPHATITMTPAAVVELVSARDPEGDDRGPGTYTYPSTPHLRSGSLDVTAFTVATSDSLVHFSMTFRALSDPGWHPEYGFQLTYAAIAIDTDARRGSGQTRVRRNASYRLPSDRAYERIIFVGGGVQVEDADGNILGAYLPRPEDKRDPLGNASTGTVRFSVPRRMLGIPLATWRYTVLVGAQDDHGGAGLGEFRSVNRIGGEWSGGGKQSDDGPNVYDVLETGGGR